MIMQDKQSAKCSMTELTYLTARIHLPQLQCSSTTAAQQHVLWRQEIQSTDPVLVSSSQMLWEQREKNHLCLALLKSLSNVVFRKTVFGDWRFDYLSGSHLQTQVKSRRQMMVFMPLVTVDLNHNQRHKCLSSFQVMIYQLLNKIVKRWHDFTWGSGNCTALTFIQLHREYLDVCGE